MVQPLKFENGDIIPSNTLQGMWLLSHAVIEVNLCQWKEPYEAITEDAIILLPCRESSLYNSFEIGNP